MRHVLKRWALALLALIPCVGLVALARQSEPQSGELPNRLPQAAPYDVAEARHFVEKLRATGRPELHLFLRIHDTAMPFSLYYPLAWGDYVPADSLDAPEGLTALWLVAGAVLTAFAGVYLFVTATAAVAASATTLVTTMARAVRRTPAGIV